MTSSTDLHSFRLTPPAIHPITASGLPSMEKYITPGGIAINTLHRADMPVIAISAVARGGFAEIGQWGAAWLKALSHSEATRSYPDGRIAKIIDYNGAQLKSSADAHFSTFAMMSLETKIDTLLPVFAEIVGLPTFPERELAVTREMLASNIEVSMENVGFLSAIEADRQFMGADHPLAGFDTPDEIRSLTTDDMVRLQERLSSRDAIELFVWGNITSDLIRSIADAFDSALPSAKAAPLNIRPFEAVAAGDMRLIVKPHASQSAVALTIPSIPRSHPDYLPLNITVYALGGYFGSRLMLNIREEKGLTYGISSSLVGYLDGSAVTISAETDNRHCHQLIDEVRTELRNLALNPPSADELTRMKRSAMSEQIAAADSAPSIVQHHITRHTLNLPESYFTDKIQTIANITPEQIAEIAGRYLNPDSLRIAIAGNPA